MRVFKAFIISLLIYALFIWLYVRYVPKLKVPLPKHNSHVIKIDIRDFPLPKKEEAVKAKMLSKEKVVVKKQPVVKVKPQKKIVKKKPVKKPIAKKKIIKKRVVKKRVLKTPMPIEEPIVAEKSESLKKFESEMVYIAEPMLIPQKTAPMPMSYPSDKIRKLYGSEFHNFTPTQKKFIEDNLETIQTITQRTLTRRGYPKGAGETGQEGTNVVTFYLHPNGDISNLRLKTRIGYRALDENTLSLIRVAYMDYPYPSTTTKITFYVKYSIYGY